MGDKIMQNYDVPLPPNSRNSLENKSTNHLCQGNLFYEYCQLNRQKIESFNTYHTVRKSRNITGQNRSPIVLYMVLIMKQNVMEKELKSCMGVLFRADLTGHGHPTCFVRKGYFGWPCPVSQVSSEKDTCAGFLFFFHNVLLHYQHHISKNWRPILP